MRGLKGLFEIANRIVELNDGRLGAKRLLRHEQPPAFGRRACCIGFRGLVAALALSSTRRLARRPLLRRRRGLVRLPTDVQNGLVGFVVARKVQRDEFMHDASNQVFLRGQVYLELRLG
jgi:hypothetical protein